MKKRLYEQLDKFEIHNQEPKRVLEFIDGNFDKLTTFIQKFKEGREEFSLLFSEFISQRKKNVSIFNLWYSNLETSIDGALSTTAYKVPITWYFGLKLGSYLVQLAEIDYWKFVLILAFLRTFLLRKHTQVPVSKELVLGHFEDYFKLKTVQKILEE